MTTPSSKLVKEVQDAHRKVAEAREKLEAVSAQRARVFEKAAAQMSAQRIADLATKAGQKISQQGVSKIVNASKEVPKKP